MNKRTIVLSVAGGALALCCALGALGAALSDDTDAATPNPSTSQAPPATNAGPSKYSDKARFPTGRYADDVRVKIDALVGAKDCKGLQAEFNQADANDAAQRTRTGEGTADLMSYIDGALKAAGCY